MMRARFRAEERAVTGEPTKPSRGGLTGLRVLVIDDLPLDRKLLRVLLMGEGCEVETAADSVQARAVLPRFEPHLVVLDVRVPSDDTLALARALKAAPATQDVIIVAVSAYNGEHNALAAGCDTYVAKPLATEAFVETLRQLLAGSTH